MRGERRRARKNKLSLSISSFEVEEKGRGKGRNYPNARRRMQPWAKASNLERKQVF